LRSGIESPSWRLVLAAAGGRWLVPRCQRAPSAHAGAARRRGRHGAPQQLGPQDGAVMAQPGHQHCQGPQPHGALAKGCARPRISLQAWQGARRVGRSVFCDRKLPGRTGRAGWERVFRAGACVARNLTECARAPQMPLLREVLTSSPQLVRVCLAGNKLANEVRLDVVLRECLRVLCHDSCCDLKSFVPGWALRKTSPMRLAVGHGRTPLCTVRHGTSRCMDARPPQDVAELMIILSDPAAPRIKELDLEQNTQLTWRCGRRRDRLTPVARRAFRGRGLPRHRAGVVSVCYVCYVYVVSVLFLVLYYYFFYFRGRGLPRHRAAHMAVRACVGAFGQHLARL
jgi:hypothetical protein